VTEVRDNPEKSRYELVEDGKLLGVADYRPMGDKLAFPHTEIVPPRRNQGLGHELVRGALDDVRRKGATVVPYCWFVADFIEENPEYADLATAGGGAGAPPSGGGRGWGPVRGGEAARSKPEDGASRP
jgi:uncharacterized protein